MLLGINNAMRNPREQGTPMVTSCTAYQEPAVRITAYNKCINARQKFALRGKKVFLDPQMALEANRLCKCIHAKALISTCG